MYQTLSARGKKNKANDKHPTCVSRGGCPLTNDRLRIQAQDDYEQHVAELKAADPNADVPEFVPPTITKADTWLGNRTRRDNSYTSEEVRKVAELMVMNLSSL